MSHFRIACNLVAGKESNPVFTVIIPVFNDNAGLKNCLDALQDQSLPHNQFEVVVVDNGSEKNPQDLIKKYPFTKIVYEHTPGSYAARNAGISVANGDYLAFLDADCIPESGWLEEGKEILGTGTVKTLIGGEVKLIQSEKPTAVELYQCLVGFQQKENIESKRFTVTANLFVRRTDAIAIGPFEENLLSGGDRDWSWRAQELGFNIQYCASAVVKTKPRRTLLTAIRQARRVTGGRYYFQRLGLANNPLISKRLTPHRNSWEALKWLCNHPGLSHKDRIPVLTVSVIIKIAQIVELWRLKIGAKAERV